MVALCIISRAAAQQMRTLVSRTACESQKFGRHPEKITVPQPAKKDVMAKIENYGLPLFSLSSPRYYENYLSTQIRSRPIECSLQYDRGEIFHTAAAAENAHKFVTMWTGP